MRADRLLSIVLLLQANHQMTSRDLASRLEVSERTIHRDMEALSGAGIPVTAAMNTFEPLFWGGLAYVVLRIIKTGNAKLWLAFGAIAGVGLLNKYSLVIFASALISLLDHC